MQADGSQVFLSYRRGDADVAATAIRKSVEGRFGAKTLFQDVIGIAPGESFSDELRAGLDRAAVMLVVIGPQWLTMSDDAGRRRLGLPDDWVAFEVATGLCSPDIRVIPLLVEGATSLTAAETEALPEMLRGLARLQATVVRPETWDRDLSPVLDEIDRALPSSPTTQPPHTSLGQGGGATPQPARGNGCLLDHGPMGWTFRISVGAALMLAMTFLLPLPDGSNSGPGEELAVPPTSASVTVKSTVSPSTVTWPITSTTIELPPLSTTTTSKLTTTTAPPTAATPPTTGLTVSIREEFTMSLPASVGAGRVNGLDIPGAGEISMPLELDSFSFTVESEQMVVFELDGSWEAAWQLLDLDGAVQFDQPLATRASKRLDPGAYRLEIRGLGSETTAYGFTVSPQSP